jgi:hypothetical protein
MLSHIWVSGKSIISRAARFWISIEQTRSTRQCDIFEGKR